MSRIERIEKLGISSREIEVLELLRLGTASNKEIGEIMGITSGTVKKHKRRLFAKLGIGGSKEEDDNGKSIKAILIGMKTGIIAEYLPDIDETQTQIYKDGLIALDLEN